MLASGVPSLQSVFPVGLAATFVEWKDSNGNPNRRSEKEWSGISRIREPCREKKMLYKLGRLLQIVGLIMLPVAIAGNLAPEPHGIDLWTSLKLSAVGVISFGLGYWLQQIGRK
jgi:hypothetical protein